MVCFFFYANMQKNPDESLRRTLKWVKMEVDQRS